MKSLVLVCALAASAAADSQIQLDVGVAHAAIGYEHSLGDRIAGQLEAIGASTLYLPPLGAGVSSLGFGGGARLTVFPRLPGKGLYATAAFRAERASAENDDGISGHGLLLAPALTVGQAFRTTSLDVRFGFGFQFIHYNIKTGNERLKADVPFLMVELVLGYRL